MDRYPRNPAASIEPIVYNSTHAPLPMDASAGNMPHEMIPHVVPTSRLETQSQASKSNSSTIGTASCSNPMNNAASVTTYTVRTDPSRDSSLHDPIRPRRSTVDNYNRPGPASTITVTQQERPVSMRPENLHQHFQPDYNNPTIMTTPPWPDHHYHLQQQQHPQFKQQQYQQHPYPQQPHYQQHPPPDQEYSHSEILDRQNVEMDQNYDVPASRIRVNTRDLNNSALRSQISSPFASNQARSMDPLADEFGEDGYGYTNPRDLVQYDLDHSLHGPEMYAKNGVEGNPRPRSLHSAYDDLVIPRTFDSRERGPPPSLRGFDKIRVESREQSTGRPSSPNNYHHRPSSADILNRPRSSSRHSREPLPLDSHDEVYHNREYPNRREAQSRRQRHLDKYDDGGGDSASSCTEKRGHGTRTSRTDRSEISDKMERNDRSDSGQKEHREFRGREVLATGLSLASAALGLTAVKSASHDESRHREDREGRRKKDIRDEPRRHREWPDEDSIEPSGLEHKDQNPRSPEAGNTRKMKKGHHGRDSSIHPPSETSSRGSNERIRTRDDPSEDYSRHKYSQHRRHPLKLSPSESSGSDEVAPRVRREFPKKETPSSAPMCFNPNDTTDLKALQQAINSQDSSEHRGRTKSVGPGLSRSSKEPSIYSKDRRLSPADERDSQSKIGNRTPRVVSPPREKIVEEKPPVKGILRQPREKFPEDPAPVREGVAPLKDAKKDGIPPDARWTKINRRLVNPEALEMGKERYEARDDFVIVLRVLTKEEVQAYADLTQKIRSAHEKDYDEFEEGDYRDSRRVRHERRKHERSTHRENRHGHRNSTRSETESFSDSDAGRSIDDAEDERMSRKSSNYSNDMNNGRWNEKDSRSEVNSGRDSRGSSVYNKYPRNPPAPAPMPPPLTNLRKDVR